MLFAALIAAAIAIMFCLAVPSGMAWAATMSFAASSRVERVSGSCTPLACKALRTPITGCASSAIGWAAGAMACAAATGVAAIALTAGASVAAGEFSERFGSAIAAVTADMFGVTVPMVPAAPITPAPPAARDAAAWVWDQTFTGAEAKRARAKVTARDFLAAAFSMIMFGSSKWNNQWRC